MIFLPFSPSLFSPSSPLLPLLCISSFLPSSFPPQELSVAMISQWRKENMRSTLNSLKKTIIDADRAATTKLVEKVH